jgi:hypothetical protein
MDDLDPTLSSLMDLIKQALDTCRDADLLDLIYKLLLCSTN